MHACAVTSELGELAYWEFRPIFNIEKSYTRYINIKTQKNTHTMKY